MCIRQFNFHFFCALTIYDNMKYIGSHISTSYNLLDGAKMIKKKGGNMMQIFSEDRRKINKDIIIKFKEFMIKNEMKVVIHASYKVNIASDWTPYSWSILEILDEIKFAHTLNAIGIVLHIGKKKELKKVKAYKNMYTFLLYIIKMTSKYKDVKILLETSSGQGSEMCYRLEDLSYFYKKFSKHHMKKVSTRVKLCVDTCHIFAAGYDIKSKNKVKMYLDAFEEIIGLKQIELIHLNDSKNKLGSKIDRHEDIGKGYIGYIGLIEFSKFFIKRGVPIVLETPSIKSGDLGILTGL